MSEPYRSLYSVIPARVRDDRALRPNAKLLYGELSALAQAEGYKALKAGSATVTAKA